MFNLPFGVDIRDVTLFLVPCHYCGQHCTVNLQLGDTVVKKFHISSAQGARELHKAFRQAGGRIQRDFLKHVQDMADLSWSNDLGGVGVFRVRSSGHGVVILVGEEVIIDPYGDPLGTRFGGPEDPWGESDLDRDLDDDP